jgi:3-phenylpropionate/trans-cinnamate dioxygenase ferredoxin subunit
VAFEAVANLDELAAGETLLVELSEPVCLIRVGEQEVRAIHNTCTHQQQPLMRAPSTGTPWSARPTRPRST